MVKEAEGSHVLLLFYSQTNGMITFKKEMVWTGRIAVFSGYVCGTHFTAGMHSFLTITSTIIHLFIDPGGDSGHKYSW